MEENKRGKNAKACQGVTPHKISRVDVNSNFLIRDVNRDDLSEMKFVAEIDSKIPVEFDAHYKWDLQYIEHRLKYYSEMKKTDYFQVCLASDGSIVGFYIIKEVQYAPNLRIGSIASLWVASQARQQGISKKFKVLGNQWAHRLGLSFLQTNVHVNNSAMIQINKDLGYESTYTVMRKRFGK